MNMEDEIMEFGTALMEGCLYVLGEPFRQSTLSGSAALFILRDDPEGLAEVIHYILDNITANRPSFAPPCPEVKILASPEHGLFLLSLPAGTNGNPNLN
jgi:hypothetical protein